MVTGTLEQLIKDMNDGVYDFTFNGKCSQCGNCCSNFLPISSKEIKAIKAYIKKHKVQEQIHFIPTASPSIDWTCPFRNNAERRCEIYAVHPAICRDFQCDKPKNKIEANKKLYHGKYSVVLMRKTFYGDGWNKTDGTYERSKYGRIYFY